jgi:maltooligosyltrehalose synthase
MATRHTRMLSSLSPQRSLRDAGIAAHVGTWIAQTEPSERANSLGQKLIQLTMPGVPDVYQGSELPLHTLVDPDNRGPVDYADRALRLAAIAPSAGLPADLGDAKLRVTACALQLRRAHPQWFVGPEAQYAAIDTGSPHALAFGRGSAGGIEAITVATIAPHRLGWRRRVGRRTHRAAGRRVGRSAEQAPDCQFRRRADRVGARPRTRGPIGAP